MRIISAVILCSALAVGTAAQSKAPAKAPAKTGSTANANQTQSSAAASARVTNEEAMEFLHHMFGYDPNIKYEVLEIKPSEEDPSITDMTVGVNGQGLRLFIMPDGKFAMQGELMPFGPDPFGRARTVLAAAAKGQPWKGNANGAVEVIEFSDYQCPHCKQALPVIDKIVADNKDVKLVFMHFPIASIHKWAEQAAAYGDCIGRKSNDQFWAFTTAVFDQQEQITETNVTEKLNELTKAAGADPGAIAACSATPETKKRIEESVQRGVSLGVSGTPTVFINGRKISSISTVPPETLKQLLEFAATENGKQTAPTK